MIEPAKAAALGRLADLETLEDLARRALETGNEEQALPLIGRAAKAAGLARLWQWKGLLERSIDEHGQALDSFAEAARLDPGDVGIARGHARVAMEAGLDAEELYRRARRLAPQDGRILIGLAAARAAQGKGEQAASELRACVEAMPMWLDGHKQLGQLLATLGRADEATASLDRAIERMEKAAPLWETLLDVQLRRGAYHRLKEIVDRAESAGIESPALPIYRGIHAAQLDPNIFPVELFASATPSIDAVLAPWRIRHLLRVGAVDAALPLIDKELRRHPSGQIWAYASTAWRLTGDPRWAWLEGDERLVSMTDITGLLPPLDTLAATLRRLHIAQGEYLDQSVRGGTQTDGPLFSRIDPVIRHLRRAIVTAVKNHVAQLPPHDPRHPALRHPRDRRVRFSGSWSVRLRSGGHHSYHVHPQGWISSALYVSLPPKSAQQTEDSGWLTLGEPDELLKVDLPPWRKIEPKAGHLALFPSHMWHGTVPFDAGERLTVAFDVAPPRSSEDRI